MINKIRNTTLIRLTCGLLGLYLLNISVDTKDLYPEHISEDLSINDQESLIELVIEKVLGFENAFKEYDDNDSQEHNKNSSHQLKQVFYQYRHWDSMHLIFEGPKKTFRQFRAFLSSGFLKLDTPPPKI